MALVEGATGQQELQGVGRVLVGLQDVGTVEQSNVWEEVIDSLEEVQRPGARLSEVITMVFSDNQRVLLDLFQHQSLDLLLRLEAMRLPFQLSWQLFVNLEQDDGIWDKPNRIQNGWPFLLILNLPQLCHHLRDVPLIGVLLQRWEGILQSHVVLLGGGVLALYDVQLMLVSDVDIEAYDCDEDNRNVQIEAE